MSYAECEQRDALLKDSESSQLSTCNQPNLSGRELRRLQIRLLGLSAALGSLLTIALTISLHIYLSASTRAVNPELSVFLPDLDLSPLGAINRVFEIEPIYRIRPNNETREAWLSLFPRGKGYVSMDKIQSAGPVADYLKSQSTDGSGRFCVAAFHQLHCLYMMYEDFYAALDGSLTKPNFHTTHCFDYLRESILCSADTTLEPFKGRFDGGGGGNGVDGFGTVHQCRNFEQVFDWAEKFRYNDDTDADRFEG